MISAAKREAWIVAIMAQHGMDYDAAEAAFDSAAAIIRPPVPIAAQVQAAEGNVARGYIPASEPAFGLDAALSPALAAYRDQLAAAQPAPPAALAADAADRAADRAADMATEDELAAPWSPPPLTFAQVPPLTAAEPLSAATAAPVRCCICGCGADISSMRAGARFATSTCRSKATRRKQRATRAA